MTLLSGSVTQACLNRLNNTGKTYGHEYAYIYIYIYIQTRSQAYATTFPNTIIWHHKERKVVLFSLHDIKPLTGSCETDI